MGNFPSAQDSVSLKPSLKTLESHLIESLFIAQVLNLWHKVCKVGLQFFHLSRVGPLPWIHTLEQYSIYGL